MTNQMSTVPNVTITTYKIGNYTRIGYIYAIHDDYVELMPTWGYAASAFVLFIIGFFGFFLNLMVIILMCKDKQLWTPLNVILFNLVCSDFSVSILGNPFTLISALSHRWIFGHTMCIAYGFFMTLLGITSITTLTVLSFERYMMVSRPLVSRHLTMRGASLSVFLIWCYSFAVSSPPLLGWGNFTNEAANISCSINWEEQTFNTLTYILFLFATGLILPVSIITFSYLNIIKTMKKNSLRMGQVSKAESKVTNMVLIMIVTFLVAWTPYSIFALVEQFSPEDVVSPGLAVIPALVAKSSICYHPIIYAGMNSQFRLSVKKVFGFGSKEDSVQDRTMENTLMSPTKPVSQINDNNIKLRYLNPKNNTLVSVTIYKEDEDEEKTGFTNCYAIKKKKQGKVKKKVTVKNNVNEDSIETYVDALNKDQNGVDDNKTDDESLNTRKTNNKSIINYRKDAKTTKKYVTYNLDNLSDNGDTITRNVNKDDTKYNNFKEFVNNDSRFENSSSGNNNEVYSSDDILLNSPDYRRRKNSYGVENRGLISWDEPNVQSYYTNDNLYYVQERGAFQFDDSPLPVRRKSLASTHYINDEFTKIHRYSGRRSSSSVLAGHTRKLSTALHGNRGPIVTRLMVDEREKSKLMCFEDTKTTFPEPRLNTEQML